MLLVALLAANCGRPSRPNVLLLVMDTTRADRCSVTGYGRPTTPCLEDFARDAVVFDDAWTPGGWTGPAHATLFTGLRPERHGFTVGDRSYLDTRAPTLAETLRGAGWDTACFTNNEFVSPAFGLVRGFSAFEPLYAREDRPRPWARETHERAAGWAEATHRAGRPFLLFVNDMEPHFPFQPPPEDWARFRRNPAEAVDLADVNGRMRRDAIPYSLGRAEVPAPVLNAVSDLYDTEIAVMDREIGALLDRLRATGLLDETIVVVVGDHGESLGEHHLLGHGYDLHRTIAHVPLIVRYPGAFDGGRVEHAVVRLEDVPATILELCGVDAPQGIDGVPLTRDLGGRVALTDQPANDGVRSFLEEKVPGADGSRLAAGTASVYDGAFHLLAYTDGRRELYDVRRDPLERDDLALRDPYTVARLLSLRRR